VIWGSRILLFLSEKIGSGVEAENVKLIKSSEEDRRFYKVKNSIRADVFIFSVNLYAGVMGAEKKRQ
jgi:hypothetical protein